MNRTLALNAAVLAIFVVGFVVASVLFPGAWHSP
jgi:hypothetical protein